MPGRKDIHQCETHILDWIFDVYMYSMYKYNVHIAYTLRYWISAWSA